MRVYSCLGITLFGTTQGGGTNGAGTLFKLKTDGTGFVVLHHFNASTDGYDSFGSLMISSNVIYGTAAFGGTAGSGTIFKKPWIMIRSGIHMPSLATMIAD